MVTFAPVAFSKALTTDSGMVTLLCAAHSLSSTPLREAVSLGQAAVLAPPPAAFVPLPGSLQPATSIPTAATLATAIHNFFIEAPLRCRPDGADLEFGQYVRPAGGRLVK